MTGRAAPIQDLVGFSDITVFHLSLIKQCGLVGIHGALTNDGDGVIGKQSIDLLRRALMTSESITIQSRPEEETSALTTKGVAKGRLVGGNWISRFSAGHRLDMEDSRSVFL